jgi:hypothetical protein
MFWEFLLKAHLHFPPKSSIFVNPLSYNMKEL